MKKNNTMWDAQQYLENLPRIHHFSERNDYDCDVFLLPTEMDFNYNTDFMIETYGINDKIDGRPHDLVRIIKVIDALNIKYEETNVLTPLFYAEYLPDILWHITTQGILFVRVSNQTIRWISDTNKTAPYEKHPFDKFWLPCCEPIENIQEGDVLCIFNRRVAGWDGSPERPVVELLGAGGHLPTIWKRGNKQFTTLSVKENLQKEIHEELGFSIPETDIAIFGGYSNTVTHELVILSGIMVDDSYLPGIQEYAVQNIDEDTHGIYMGKFDDVIRYYKENPTPFAGGAKAAPTNFPNNEALMKKVHQHFNF